MQKKYSHLILYFSLAVLMSIPAVNAQSWIDEGAREFEELRLSQLQTVQNQSVISPFTTDGCSGSQSDIWEFMANTFPGFEQQFSDKPPWESCCVTHDKVYWRGEVVDGYTKRKRADKELKLCVIATGQRLAPQLSTKYSTTEEKIRDAFSVIADLMYRAVRLGGQPCSLLPWRWGYGWPNCAFASMGEVPVIYSDIKPDEHVTFFNTAAWLDADNSHWHLPIHAWIYEPEDSVVRRKVLATVLESKYELKETPATSKNFEQRVNLLIADNERGKILVIRMAGQDFTLPESEENGHIHTVLKLPTEQVNAASDLGRIRFFAVTQAGDDRRFEGEIQLVPHSGISVISDIDDTIKVSNVTNHKLLFENTFFENFKEVSGMSVLYRKLADQDIAVHFVSSSPWQLYDPLQAFARDSGFPWATMNLKMVRFRDETFLNLFKKGTETKPAQIEPILQRYPQRQFILIGDSGEEDPEVYGDMARLYPFQVCKILIRNVDNSALSDTRYKKTFKNIDKSKWQLFDRPEQISVDHLLDCK